MSDWTNSHDLVYAFVCVSFLADGDVDESEKEATQNKLKCSNAQQSKVK